LPKPAKKISGRDILAGFVNAITNIPDSMANAVLAGVNPIHGLYALLAGTPVASMTTSSSFLTVVVTAAMALAVGDALSGIAEADRASALVALAVMIGVVKIALGLLKGDTMLRFVSNAVMRGFLTGVALSIVINQFPEFFGVSSDASNKVLAAIDIITHPLQIHLGTALVGVATIALILATERTQIKRFATPLALIVVTAVVAILGMDVRAVSDIAEIPRALPSLQLPTVSLLLNMALPAVAVALIGVIQGAGVSKSTPNPDGRYPSIARDFIGQGLGNVTSGLFGGMPVGGSVSSTAINVQAGAASRWANFTIGPVIALVLLLFAGGVELIPMASLAAVLVVVGIRAIDVPRILAVWHASLPTGVVMVVTFVSTLFMPVHFAVMLGAGLSLVQYVYSSSLDVRVVRLKRDSEGRFAEVPAPEELADLGITVLDIYGSIFYAGADSIERMLPDPAGSEAPVVIMRLRGRVDVGSTFIGVLRRYRIAVLAVDGRFMIAGVGEELRDQMERTGFLDALGRENVFDATPVLTESLSEALKAAEQWEDTDE